jgi:hypothetical protein
MSHDGGPPRPCYHNKSVLVEPNLMNHETYNISEARHSAIASLAYVITDILKSLKEQGRRPFLPGEAPTRLLRDIRHLVVDAPPTIDAMCQAGFINDHRRHALIKEVEVVAAELEQLCSKINKRSEELKRGRSNLNVQMRYKGYDDLAEKLERMVSEWETDDVSFEIWDSINGYISIVCSLRLSRLTLILVTDRTS